MILRPEKHHLTYWQWIYRALESENHPLHERFEDLEAEKVLVSRDEFDLIMEAVKEYRDEFVWALKVEVEDGTEEAEDLEGDVEILDEIINFLNACRAPYAHP